jgi:hypothetical protein
MNIKAKIWILAFGISLFNSVYNESSAQCEDKLIDRGIARSGNDALFIREFVLKANNHERKKKAKSPGINSQYDVRLNKRIVYRFIVENEENTSAQAILQLKNNNMILGSTYDIDNKINIGSFDFICEESGQYKVILSFVDGNTSCAAGAMFAVIQDSMSLSSVIDSSEIQNILYTGVDNYIDIAASDIPDGSLDVSINRGTIEKAGGLYKIRIDEPGKVTVDVVAKDKNGKVTETFKTEFIVNSAILPTISLARNSGGIIKKSDILNSNQTLEVNSFRSDLQYKIKKFNITKGLSMQGIINDNDNKLNYRQLSLIRELKTGDTFYITNIEIEDSKGKIYQLQPLGYIIGE